MPGGSQGASLQQQHQAVSEARYAAMSHHSPAPGSLPQPFSSPARQPLQFLPGPSPPRLSGSNFLWGQAPPHESQHSHTPPPADLASQAWSHQPGLQQANHHTLHPPGVTLPHQQTAPSPAQPGLGDGQSAMDYAQLLADPAVQQLLHAQPAGSQAPRPGSATTSHPPHSQSHSPPASGQPQGTSLAPAAQEPTPPLGSQDGSQRPGSVSGSKQSPGRRVRPGASPPPGFPAPAASAGAQQQRTQQLLSQHAPQQQEQDSQAFSTLPHPRLQQSQQEGQQQNGAHHVPEDPQAQSVLLLQALQADPNLLLSLLSGQAPGGQDSAAAQLRSRILENICKNPAAWDLTEEPSEQAQQAAGGNGGPDRGVAASSSLDGWPVPPDRLSGQAPNGGLHGPDLGSLFPGHANAAPPGQPGPTMSAEERWRAAAPQDTHGPSDTTLYESLYGGEHGGELAGSADHVTALPGPGFVAMQSHCFSNRHNRPGVQCRQARQVSLRSCQAMQTSVTITHPGCESGSQPC